MKIYLVVDSYQYDGGVYIEGAFQNSNDALILRQKLRRNRKKAWRLRDNETTPLEAICIEEVEVK